MSERKKLIEKVQMYDFALLEVVQYLDTHPSCEAALAYYRKLRAAFDKAAAEYEDAFGPLTCREVDVQGGSWNWIYGPWPWEREAN